MMLWCVAGAAHIISNSDRHEGGLSTVRLKLCQKEDNDDLSSPLSSQLRSGGMVP